MSHKPTWYAEIKANDEADGNRILVGYIEYYDDYSGEQRLRVVTSDAPDNVDTPHCKDIAGVEDAIEAVWGKWATFQWLNEYTA